MADLKISALTASTTPLTGTEVLPIVQSSTTKQVSIANVTAGRAVSTLSATSLGPNGIPITLQEITAAPSSATAAYVGVSTSAFPGGANGDLILIPRTSGANDVRVFVGSGTPTEALVVQGSSKDVRVVAGNLVMATSGKGIDFSATSGSGTSELLADYEEGTWTPVDSSGASLSLTITGTSTYTKIGRQVIATADITYPVTVSASLTLIGGLPFTTAAAPSGAGSIGYTDYGTWITASPGGAVSSFRFIGAGGFLTNANLSGKRVQVTIVYTV